MNGARNFSKLADGIIYMARSLTGRFGEQTVDISVKKNGMGKITIKFDNVTGEDVKFFNLMLDAGVRLAHGDHVDGFPVREDLPEEGEG